MTETQQAGLRGLTDDELADLYNEGDDATRAAVMDECTRRDRAARAAAERERIRAEWHDAAYADYLAAEEECRGELVNPAGVAAGVPDGFALWSGPLTVALKYATEELRDWWKEHPRVTFTEYQRMRARQLEASEPFAVPDVVTVMTASYRGVVTVCTPGQDGGETREPRQCPHVAYGHESDEAARACARRMAAQLGLTVRQDSQ